MPIQHIQKMLIQEKKTLKAIYDGHHMIQSATDESKQMEKQLEETEERICLFPYKFKNMRSQNWHRSCACRPGGGKNGDCNGGRNNGSSGDKNGSSGDKNDSRDGSDAADGKEFGPAGGGIGGGGGGEHNGGGKNNGNGDCYDQDKHGQVFFDVLNMLDCR